jgi:hypothetical protein
LHGFSCSDISQRSSCKKTGIMRRVTAKCYSIVSPIAEVAAVDPEQLMLALLAGITLNNSC